MSWTDDMRLKAFFQNQLVPTAEKLKGRGVRFFPRGPEDAAAPFTEQESDSFFVKPPSDPQVFTREPGDLAAALHTYWQSQQLPEMAELAAPLVSLSKRLETTEQQADDISPFVYVLY